MKLDILAFGAHPDDVELGCSGTIVKEISLSKKVGIIDLTRGELGTRGSVEIRNSEAEAAAIRKIIKEFKFHSAPELLKGSSGRFFVPPAEFDIKFFYNGKENLNIHKISSCVLVGIDINYAAAGQWTTFSDGMPVDISMQLRFKEVEIIHKALVMDGY